jgi:hypothetical protein
MQSKGVHHACLLSAQNRRCAFYSLCHDIVTFVHALLLFTRTAHRVLNKYPQVLFQAELLAENAARATHSISSLSYLLSKQLYLQAASMCTVFEELCVCLIAGFRELHEQSPLRQQFFCSGLAIVGYFPSRIAGCGQPCVSVVGMPPANTTLSTRLRCLQAAFTTAKYNMGVMRLFALPADDPCAQVLLEQLESCVGCEAAVDLLRLFKRSSKVHMGC